jgi:hypothetical protein
MGIGMKSISKQKNDLYTLFRGQLRIGACVGHIGFF